MRLTSSSSLAGLIAFSALTLGGCASSAINPTENAIASSGMDLSLFAEGAFTQEPEIVDCETAEGTSTYTRAITTIPQLAVLMPQIATTKMDMRR